MCVEKTKDTEEEKLFSLGFKKGFSLVGINLMINSFHYFSDIWMVYFKTFNGQKNIFCFFVKVFRFELNVGISVVN